MLNFTNYTSRRTFLRVLAGTTLGAAVTFPPMLRQALAMGAFDIPAGMQKVQGRVTVNGRVASEGDPVAVGDVVETGDGALAIFVIGKDVFLVREKSRLEPDSVDSQSAKTDIAEVLRILKGQVLAVFGPGRKQLRLPTATVGVRGTGVYVEAYSAKTYYCTCYGVSEISPVADPTQALVVETQYHEAPVWVYGTRAASGTNSFIEEAPVLNHTDAELIMLESIVFRKPPFHDEDNPSKGGY